MNIITESVIVEKYNPDWVSWFEQLCSFLEPKLGPNVIRIEHVGSTSIQGMMAKPIIDLDIVIRISEFDEIKSCLEEIGYFHQGDLGIPEREAFALRNLELKNQLPPHHLYVCHFHSKELHQHMDIGTTYVNILKTQQTILNSKYDWSKNTLATESCTFKEKTT